jgi:hypothetical protein
MTAKTCNDNGSPTAGLSACGEGQPKRQIANGKKQ